ncbi:hypothetical protein [Flavobacterium sp. NKUCC04_CG]|uniref:hypothetical protein n=1 Tax=Flavobacterium sp. NKUCC04_CG TaxID=2842121 RepID=UPI001C5BE334|nr:hypothetical protein [Flavobacterium sp. NKUCC04_CG]MBW3517653.1 hypothetical protein [Flavobacterium sp. NKUCC04_CG]
MKKYVFLLLVVLLIGCTSTVKPAVSFYYWKTVFKLSATEKEVLQENEVSKLYLRYFDIALRDGIAVPLSPIRFQDKTTSYKIVPVVYVKNEVMLDNQVNVEELADQTLSMIGKINTVNLINVDEIQIDCDWTLKSKDQFMTYIDALRRKANLKISATIRLHQIKYYKETGVPNVDQGVLMYYNMGQVASDDLNSIYDEQIAARYIKSLSTYPLSLDVALPIFGWGVHIRNQKVIGLIPKINEKQLLNTVKATSKSKNRFEINEDIIAFGTYFRQGDQVKMETVSKADLRKMVSNIKKNLKTVPKEIIYYDLDSINLKNYSNEKEFYKKVNSGF